MELNAASRSVLYVEDDENDVFFVTRAFAKVSGPRVEVAATGKDALDYLTDALKGLRPRPALVLLDLNLPFLSGHEVLAWIRQQPGGAELPVVVFTSSAQRSDITRAYAAGATAYVVKPNAPARTMEIAAALGRVADAPSDARRILETAPGFQPAESPRSTAAR